MSVEVSLGAFVDGLCMGHGDEVVHYLNVKTGEIEFVLREDLGRAEELDEIPDSAPESVREAAEILGSDDWIELPGKDEIAEADVVQEFCDSYPDRRKRDRLRRAFNGRGAFRRFKDALDELDLREVWFRYRDQAFAEFAKEWLDEKQIPFRNDLPPVR